jgi:hypothetical protein
MKDQGKEEVSIGYFGSMPSATMPVEASRSGSGFLMLRLTFAKLFRLGR